MRLYIKQIYMRARGYQEIEGLVETVADCLAVPLSNIERPLSTVTVSELWEAIAVGVDIQSHGWSHINPCMLSEGERLADVQRNEDYLSQLRTVDTSIFVPPFGQQVSFPSKKFELMLLADRNVPPNYKRGDTANRQRFEPSRIWWSSIKLDPRHGEGEGAAHSLS
jgi:hypothetical protein